MNVPHNVNHSRMRIVGREATTFFVIPYALRKHARTHSVTSIHFSVFSSNNAFSIY